MKNVFTILKSDRGISYLVIVNEYIKSVEPTAKKAEEVAKIYKDMSKDSEIAILVAKILAWEEY